MALTPQNNDVFLREVDEELRRDEMRDFMTRWGRWVIVAVIAALVAFGGWLFWQNRQEAAAGEQGEAFSAALDDLAANKADAARVPLETLASSDRDGYRAMARFTQADILLQRDDLKGAAAKFAEIAGDSDLAQPYRDLALIRQTSAEFDSLQPAQVIDRLRGLATKDSPWFGSAGELVAIAYMRMNRPQEAGRMFGEIARTETVPETIRQRAVQLAGVLGVDAVDQPQEKTGE
ncbi:tetratricopeptide repeat protein [Sphingomonas baiyangensis]|uniref:Tetratricopeptide repeat protein n=1 Tax=Sphingomonas baiyangensis TaxID=2572576 RepID=A0A4U1L1U4_9SPHN|nr:tetratricopeptide repeat protein [Sphingomonas baiyangensis]TKD50170.1 tetratricopeptide repeat protein [Sphingomonas baiyangensis]